MTGIIHLMLSLKPVPPDRWKLSVAPMMDWSDRNCRYFHRLLTRHALLYTEMVTTGALVHGDVARHLRYNVEEHPIALQLGGSEPADLAQGAKLGEQWGYDEINLNCGCPSERVQRGAFGACLMNEPQLVADCVKAMVDVVQVPVTVKHRIGIDKMESYDFVRDFIGAVSEAGCPTFIVHARNAWLKGPEPQRKPRSATAAVRAGIPTKKRLSTTHHRRQRRHHHQRASGRAPGTPGRCDAGPRGVSQPLVARLLGCGFL